MAQTFTTTGAAKIVTVPLTNAQALVVAGDGSIAGNGSLSASATALGTLDVTGAGTAIELTTLAVAGALNLDVASGAHLTVDAVTGLTAASTYTIEAGGTLTLGSAADISALQTIDFGGADGTLELAGGTGVSVLDQVANFGPGSSLQLDGVSFDDADSSYANGVLTLGNGTTSTSIDLGVTAAGAADNFHLTTVGGNTMLTLTSDTSTGFPACYLRGTRVLTDQGEKAVEDLAIGDFLVTANGAVRALRWIGNRSYAARFVAANRGVLPVLIRAGALAEGIPHRDLFVSPAHAMFLHGVLVPAASLVNGTSVIQSSDATDIHYYHLELGSHDVILAEGALSETFVDDDSRGMFHNAASFYEMYPDAADGPARYYAPRVEDGFVLEMIRAGLAARALPNVATVRASSRAKAA